MARTSSNESPPCCSASTKFAGPTPPTEDQRRVGGYRTAGWLQRFPRLLR